MLRRTAERIRDFVSNELVLLGFLGIGVAGTWGFASIADEVVEGDTQSFDERVVRMLRSGEDLLDTWGPAWLEKAALDVTALGGVAVFALLTGAAAVYMLLTRHYARMWLILAATIGGGVLVTTLKEAFGRPRPDVVPHLTSEHSMSFPSGHAALSAAVYLTLGVLLAQATPERRVKLFFMATAMLLTLAIGASRVYLGVHYPTDVLAGWCIGMTWAAAVSLAGHAVMRWRERGQTDLGVQAEPQ